MNKKGDKPVSENEPLPEKRGLLETPYRPTSRRAKIIRRVLFTESVRSRSSKKEVPAANPYFTIKQSLV